MSLTVTSPAFADGSAIPPGFTCDGENHSPPLAWTGIPDHTGALALVCTDPDAPGKTWVHWLAWNIPPGSPGLPANVPQRATLESGGRQGRNDSGHHGYDGPCPPKGGPHRYYFSIFALDEPLPLQPGASRPELEAAMDGHVLATGRLMGTYQRHS